MINFKNSKGKKYFAGFIAIILVAAMVLSLCITIFHRIFMHSSCHNIQKSRISVKYISSYDA